MTQNRTESSAMLNRARRWHGVICTCTRMRWDIFTVLKNNGCESENNSLAAFAFKICSFDTSPSNDLFDSIAFDDSFDFHSFGLVVFSFAVNFLSNNRNLKGVLLLRGKLLFMIIWADVTVISWGNQHLCRKKNGPIDSFSIHTFP